MTALVAKNIIDYALQQPDTVHTHITKTLTVNIDGSSNKKIELAW